MISTQNSEEPIFYILLLSEIFFLINLQKEAVKKGFKELIPQG